MMAANANFQCERKSRPADELSFIQTAQPGQEGQIHLWVSQVIGLTKIWPRTSCSRRSPQRYAPTRVEVSSTLSSIVRNATTSCRSQISRELRYRRQTTQYSGNFEVCLDGHGRS